MAANFSPATTRAPPSALAPNTVLIARMAGLGARIRLARMRRKLRQSDMAAKSGLSLSTVKAVERGAPATGLGAYVQILWILGMDRELDLVADPGLDREGLIYSPEQKRVMLKRRVDNDF